jgi:reverse gyrase
MGILLSVRSGVRLEEAWISRDQTLERFSTESQGNLRYKGEYCMMVPDGQTYMDLSLGYWAE